MADAITNANTEDITTVRILDNVIRSFSLCPIDTGMVPFPALRVLESAKLAEGYSEPAFIGHAATRNDCGELRVPSRVGLVTLKILCGAAANLQCVPTRTLEAAR